MASLYPAALDALATNKTNASTSATDHPAHHNDLADAINKIEAELGVDPSGSFATLVARLNGEITCRKTADQANSTVTLTNVTDLAFPVTVGADHTFEFTIPYLSSATGTGVGFAVTVPTLGAGGYISYVTEIHGQAANVAVGAGNTISNVPHHAHFEASGQAVASTSPSTVVANAIYLARIIGVLSNPSAAGSIQVQHRSETAVSTTVKKGASGVMRIN